MIIAMSIVGLLLAALLGTLFPGVPALLVPAGVSLLIASVALIRRAALHRLGSTETLCVLFLSLAAAHIFFGFLLADLTTQHTSIRSNAEVYYANALLINSVGLFAAAIGYSWRLNGQALALRSGFPVLIDSEFAEHLFRLLVVIGAAMMFLVYWRLGLWDYLRVPAKWPFLRYITSEIAGGSVTDEWFANRAMDLLTVSIPFLVYRASKSLRIVSIVLIVAGYLALLLPLRRANLLGVLFASLILVGIGRRNVYHLTRRWLLIMAGFYIFTQCLFLFGVFYDDLHPQTVLAVSSTALPEVRDLAWTLNRLDGDRLNGVTFAQALIPLPSIASNWSAAHSLRAITTRLIGVDQTGESGGLRLTIMGEAYINFGYPGVILISFLWGCGVAWCEKLLWSIYWMRSEFSNYVAVMCFISLCFLIYLAGTQAGASIKVGALLICAVAWACKYRARFTPVLAEAAGT